MPGVSNAPPAGRPASPPDAGAAGRLRVVLAEDDVLLREGVASLLDQAGFEVAGQAGDADGLLALVRETRPDLVVVDIRMPPTRTTEGLEAAQVIRRQFPQTAILVLSAHVDVEHATELVGVQRRSDPLAALSSREREVLALMAEGRSNTGIARRLWVTEGTVEKHIRSILAKLGLPETEDDHRRVLAVLTFLEAS